MSAPDSLVDEASHLGNTLRDIRADIPKETCPQINDVLDRIRNPRSEADRYTRASYDRDGYYGDELRTFAGEVDAVLWSLPDQLEALRSANGRLRDAVHELGSHCHEAGRLLIQLADALDEARAEIAELQAAREAA